MIKKLNMGQTDGKREEKDIVYHLNKIETIYDNREELRACAVSLHARLACIFSAIFCQNPR